MVLLGLTRRPYGADKDKSLNSRGARTLLGTHWKLRRTHETASQARGPRRSGRDRATSSPQAVVQTKMPERSESESIIQELIKMAERSESIIQELIKMAERSESLGTSWPCTSTTTGESRMEVGKRSEGLGTSWPCTSTSDSSSSLREGGFRWSREDAHLNRSHRGKSRRLTGSWCCRLSSSGRVRMEPERYAIAGGAGKMRI